MRKKPLSRPGAAPYRCHKRVVSLNGLLFSFVRRRRLSLLVKIEGDPLNTQHAQHRPVQEEEEEAVFIRGVNTNEDSPNAQHAPHRPVQDTGGGGGGRQS